MGCGLFLFILGVAKISTSKYEFIDERIIVWPITTAAGFGIIAINVNSFLMAWVAPKIWLLKEIATLIRG